jgi:hypothetical protein
MAVGIVNRTRTILASAARTTTQTGSDINNNKYVTLHATITALTATGTASYLIYPGLSQTEEGGFTLVSNAPLPKTWRVVVTAGNANACTYSVGAVELI